MEKVHALKALLAMARPKAIYSAGVGPRAAAAKPERNPTETTTRVASPHNGNSVVRVTIVLPRLDGVGVSNFVPLLLHGVPQTTKAREPVSE